MCVEEYFDECKDGGSLSNFFSHVGSYISFSKNTDLHALFTLNTLHKSRDSEVDCLIVVHVLFVVSFKVLSKFFALLSNGIGFPFSVNTGRFSLVESRFAFTETGEESRDTVRSYTTLLSRFLLYLSNHAGNVLNIRFIFVSESETLAFKSSLVNQNTGIGLESCESNHQVFVNLLNFADSSRVL